MDSSTLGVIAMIMVTGGFIAGAIAYSKIGTNGSFIGFFIFGALFPLIGILVAAFTKPEAAPPQPPGWYGDPWGQTAWRWWDGQQWTWQTG